jgi:hypothetical protein
MFKKRYRIVRDTYAGYEVQVKRWWWPWWTCHGFNTHLSLESAKRYAEQLKNPVVVYL